MRADTIAVQYLRDVRHDYQNPISPHSIDTANGDLAKVRYLQPHSNTKNQVS